MQRVGARHSTIIQPAALLSLPRLHKKVEVYFLKWSLQDNRSNENFKFRPIYLCFLVFVFLKPTFKKEVGFQLLATMQPLIASTQQAQHNSAAAHLQQVIAANKYHCTEPSVFCVVTPSCNSPSCRLLQTLQTIDRSCSKSYQQLVCTPWK